MSVPTHFHVTAQTIDGLGRWVEGTLRLWVNETGDVHVNAWVPTRVLPEAQLPGPATTFGESHA